VVSVAVMPMGILGVVAMPFGFDGVFWHLMGGGIDWMVWVAQWVGSLPGAVGRIQALGTGPLLVGTAGMLLICLLRTPLRLSGAALVLGVSLWAITSPRPDVLVADDGQTVAIRGPDGRLSVLRSSRDPFRGQGMAGRRCGRANTEGRQPEYGCDLRCDRLYRAAGGRTSCVDGAGGRGLCRGLRTCGRGGERPRGTIIELCGNAGRSRGLAHAWRHRIALERPTLRARRYTSIGLPTSVDTCDGERCGGRAGANQPAPRDASPRSEFLEADD
jgi:competence protein ComEC